MLFLAPPNAYTQDPHYYGNREQIEDRAAGGKGFTLAELDQLWVKEPRHSSQQFEHWSNRDSYVANKANWHMEEVELLPIMEPTRQKTTHVEACLKEIDGLRQQVETYKQKLLAHIASLDADIRAHLWVIDAFAEPAARSLDGTRREVDTLLARIGKLRQGFEMLPREDDVGADSHETWAEADAGGI